MRRLVSRSAPTLVALAAAAIVLVVVAWFNTTVMRDVQEQVRTSAAAWGMMTVLKALLVAGSVLLLGVLAWRSASLVVGLAYGVVGGFFMAQVWIIENLASYRNDVLPEAVALALRNLFLWSTGGAVLNDVSTIGAGMVIAGFATLARWWRVRPVAAGSVGVMDPTADPTLA